MNTNHEINLFGDGIHDDTKAIQAFLDSGALTVHLPAPKKFYSISNTLLIHSNTSLVLDRTAVIRLADGANCHMLKNAEKDAHGITVMGGIWDFNNKNQDKNPLQEELPGITEDDLHYIFYFDFVTDLKLAALTMKDPVVFASTLSYVTQFTVDDITFDFNDGNPLATNMDGIHLNGGCRMGRITNLKGACYDDLVALNADEGHGGPIEDIVIDGIFCSDCHSAVRLLSRGHWVRRIHIMNVFGTFYQYCVGITRFNDEGQRGRYDQICLSNIYASKAERLSVYGKDGMYVYALIWIEGGIDINNLQINQLHRRESVTAIPTVYVLEGAAVRLLSLEHLSQENETGKPLPLILNEGVIGKLFLRDTQVLGDTLLQNGGTIGQIFADEDAKLNLS